MTIKASNYPTTRPTLDLNFAQTKRLDPRVTFSRASTATVTDQNGVIRSAAVNVPRFDHNPVTGESLGLLVEEARTNTFQYSNNFSNAYWSTYRTVTANPNGGLAPDGTLTANYVDSAGVLGGRNRHIGGVAPGFVSISVHVKSKTATSAYIYCDIDGVAASCSATYTFATNTATSSIGDANGPNNFRNLSAQAISLPNGWTRFVFVFDKYGGSGTGVNILFGLSGGSGWMWGACQEAGAFPTSYIPTPATFTGRTSTATFYDASGIIQTAASGVARSNAFFPDANGVMRPAGLLLEAAGTNLLNGSETFATTGGTQNNWVDTNITRDGTLRTSPDGTADALQVTAAAANAAIISSAAIGTSAQRTFSIFLRRVTGTGNIQYTLDNGTTWTTQVITGSWVRYGFPATTANQQIGIRIITSGDAIELWGAQLETGTYPTSYIPTVASTVTRSADTSTSATVTRSADVAQITGTDFSGWWNANSSTYYASIFSQARSKNNNGILGIAGSDDRPVQFTVNATATNQVQISTRVGGAFYNSSVFAIPFETPIKAAGVINSTEVKLSVNGTLGSGSVPPRIASSVPTTMGIGRFLSDSQYSLNGTIARLTYWPVRLPDATLQTLTR